MIEKTKKEIIESFWRAGFLPRKSTIRIGASIGGGKYQASATGIEIPGELLEDSTLEELQGAVDIMDTMRYI